jgi:hypothetical protein
MHAYCIVDVLFVVGFRMAGRWIPTTVVVIYFSLSQFDDCRRVFLEHTSDSMTTMSEIEAYSSLYIQ